MRKQFNLNVCAGGTKNEKKSYICFNIVYNIYGTEEIKVNYSTTFVYMFHLCKFHKNVFF